MKQLRSLFNLSGITSYLHVGELKKIGIITWKSSHKAGGYFMTLEGKMFVESDGNQSVLEYFRNRWNLLKQKSKVNTAPSR